MQVTGHAATGAAAGASLGLIPGLITSTFVLVLTILGCAGMALLADIDHPKATVAQSFGWPTRTLAQLIETLTGWIYGATRTGRDQVRLGGHRTLTHTILFAAGMFFLTLWLASNTIANVTILFLALYWGIRGFLTRTTKLTRKWIKKLIPKKLRQFLTPKLLMISMASVVPLLMFADKMPLLSSWSLALIVGWGTLVHSLGDCLTDSGAPLFFPLPIHGQVWYRVKAPLRFSTGSEYGKLIERRIKWLCLMFIALTFFLRWYAL
jgi:membrane-bound metal-dependent hydrolase YbcI (DUF457 family)